MTSPGHKEGLQSTQILDLIRKSVDVVVKDLQLTMAILVTASCPTLVSCKCRIKKERKGVQAYLDARIRLAVQRTDVVLSVQFSGPAVLAAGCSKPDQQGHTQ